MTSAVDIANMALDQVSARFYITSLDPPLPAPNAAILARWYTPSFGMVARAAHWNCLRVQADLTLLKAARGTPENPDGTAYPVPPRPWLYEYAWPADCLKARFLVQKPPDSATDAVPLLGAGWLANPPLFAGAAGFPFQVAIDTDSGGNRVKVILTDLEWAQLVYTAEVTNPDLWDTHFQTAVASTLAAWTVMPIKNEPQALQTAIGVATNVIQQARVSDGNEGTTTTDRVPDWMAVRGLSAYQVLDAPRSFYGWDSISFPGGVLV